MASRFIDSADCAVMVRADLKRHFPGVKFSVRTDRYAGGSSIRVRWTDGPKVEQVERIAKRREGADFDGMTDCKNYKRGLLSTESGAVEEVSYGADYVFCTRNHSDAFRARAVAWMADRYQRDLSTVEAGLLQTLAYRVCYAMDADGNVTDENFHPFRGGAWESDAFYAQAKLRP